MLTLNGVAELLDASYHRALQDGSPLITKYEGSDDNGMLLAQGRTGLTVKVSTGSGDDVPTRKDLSKAFEPECVLMAVAYISPTNHECSQDLSLGLRNSNPSWHSTTSI